MHKPSEGAVYRTAYSTDYPGTSGPQSVEDDNNVDKFRDRFFHHIVTDLCWNFTAHISKEEFKRD